MALARLFWTVDTAISHLPDLLAQLAAAAHDRLARLIAARPPARTSHQENP
jgi:hypothetical protein